MNKISKREPYWDVLRGIAILLVLLGHSIQCSCSFGSLSCFDNPLYRLIYSFHMPLFMIICGFFFYGTICHNSTRQVVKKKVQSLVVPIVVFGLLAFPIFYSGEFSVSNIVHHLLSSMTILWFLCQIVLCSATVLFVNRILGDNIIVYIFLCVFSMFVPNVVGLERYSFMLPMFVLGYYLNKYNWIRFITGPDKVKVCFLFGVAFFLLFMIYNRDSFIYTSKTFLFGQNHPIKQLIINIYRIIIGIIGSLFIMTLVRIASEKIHKDTEKSKLAILGRWSMGIYCFQIFFWHYYSMVPFVKTVATKSFPISVIIGLFISLLLCCLLTYFSSLNRVTRLLFLGNRE